MSTSTVSSHSHVDEMVYHQDRYRRRRRFIRDFLLKRIGLGLLVRAEIRGADMMPACGPTLVIMNHIAAIDPFVVVAAVKPRFLVPMTKVENYQHPIIGLMARAWGAYPVRRGEVDRQALDSTIALLRQEQPVLIAPEGTRHHALSEVKDGMTYVAIKANAAIVPVGLDGTDQFASSLKRLRRAPVTITFGRPFRFRTEGRTRIPRAEMSLMTQEAMYQLAALLPEQHRGTYHDLDQMTTDYLEFLD